MEFGKLEKRHVGHMKMKEKGGNFGWDLEN